ncbi:hypothetical protein OHA21_00030 [Actinoplanes sp. NBC_00393]|uniref:hypothetical protein n=1 Tax=Actinoplanes sp. NBC_00393 TaxID=2975953 RepID=UPI002E2504AF
MAGELFVDVAGMNSLYNHLRAAGDDAEDASIYVRKHCDLSSAQQGIITQVMTPHDHAYEEMTAALSRLRSLINSAATQVNMAQVEYSQRDLASAADLDRGYPGAENPGVLASSLAQERFQLPAGHSSFSNVRDAAEHLTTPQDPKAEFWSINPVVDLISPFAYLRQAAIWVFNHDPFELWTEWFAGDWDSYITAGEAMARAGDAAAAIGDNLAAGAVVMPVVWRGNAAENFQEYDLRLAAAARSVQELGRNFKELYDQAADAVKSLYDVVSGLIVKMFDALLIVSIGLAGGTAMVATFAGAVVGYSVALSYAIYAIDLYNEIATVYGNAEAMIKAIGGSITALKSSAELMELPNLEPYRRPGN